MGAQRNGRSNVYQPSPVRNNSFKKVNLFICDVLFLLLFFIFFRSVPDAYVDKLTDQGIMSQQQCSEIYDEHFDWLNEELQASEDWKPKV